MSRRSQITIAIATGALVLGLVAQASLASAKDADNILKWDTMVGVPTGLTGAQSNAPLRGLNGGGIAWTLTEGHGKLTVDGHLEIKVDGLVLASGANAGNNPSATFRARVSCVNADGTFTNILTTDAFPATTGPASAGGGDSKIETDVVLPSPCIAPIVFVTSATGSWFASTGH